MNIREEQEKREHLIFSPYASFSDESRGRDRDEEPCIRETETELFIVRHSGV